MMNFALAEAHEIHNLMDFIPGIHEWYREFGEYGSTWLNGTHISFSHVMLTVLSMAAVVFLVFKSWKKFKPTPDAKLTPRTFFEIIIEAIHNLLLEQVRDKQKVRRYMPLIFALAIFIFFNNVCALIPGLAPATDNLNTNVGMALIIFFVSNIAGIREKGFLHYFAEFLGPIRKWYGLPLMILMFPIEIIGQLVRPVTLSVRLMGNMYGDHAVVAVLMTLVAAGIPAVMMCLGALVVVIQTAVFCILSVVYISMAISE